METIRCMKELSKRRIRRICKHALYEVADGDPDGMCDPTSVEVCEQLDDAGYDYCGLSKGYIFGEPHYVAIIQGEQTDFTTCDRVLVDPTIQQFSGMTEQELPEVAIVLESDTKWNTWYDGFERVSDKRLQDGS